MQLTLCSTVEFIAQGCKMGVHLCETLGAGKAADELGCRGGLPTEKVRQQHFVLLMPMTIHQADKLLHVLRLLSGVHSPAQPCCWWGWDPWVGVHPHSIASFDMGGKGGCNAFPMVSWLVQLGYSPGRTYSWLFLEFVEGFKVSKATSDR